MNNIETQLQKIFTEIFPNLNNFNLKLNKKDVFEWDSIGHLNLIVELEDTFNVSFSKQEINNINNIEDVLRIIKSKKDVN
jgi:acyl carrier protein